MITNEDSLTKRHKAIIAVWEGFKALDIAGQNEILNAAKDLLAPTKQSVAVTPQIKPAPTHDPKITVRTIETSGLQTRAVKSILLQQTAPIIKSKVDAILLAQGGATDLAEAASTTKWALRNLTRSGDAVCVGGKGKNGLWKLTEKGMKG